MKKYWILFTALMMALAVATPAMAGKGGNKPPKPEDQPTLYKVTMEFVDDKEGLSTTCLAAGQTSMEMVGTTRGGELTLESDAAEIYIRAPLVKWERKYPTSDTGAFDTGVFNECHGPSIYTQGDGYDNPEVDYDYGGHLWIHFLADGTINLNWHFDYYIDDNAKKGRSKDTVRQNFSMGAAGAPVDWEGEWLGDGTREWQGTVHLGWFLVENGKVITDGYELFPPGGGAEPDAGTEMSFTLTVEKTQP